MIIIFKKKKSRKTEMIFKFLMLIKNKQKKAMTHKIKKKPEPNLIIQKIKK